MKKEALVYLLTVFTTLSLTGCGGSSNPKTTTDTNLGNNKVQSPKGLLMNLSDWKTYGTINKSTDGVLTIGDKIGYDTDDSDKDGNTWGNQNEDDDVSISKKSFSYPISLTFTGTLSPTIYGYHRIGLMYKSSNNKVDQTSGAWFGLDWENGDNLYAYVQGKGIKLLKDSAGVPIKANDGKLQGDFKINWSGTNAIFYYNGKKIYQENLTNDNTKEIKVFVKTFDAPISFSNIVITEL